jgi:E3 ubiquitin-protein ligase XIAP
MERVYHVLVLIHTLIQNLFSFFETENNLIKKVVLLEQFDMDNDKDFDLKCNICLINKKNVAYEPCGHVSSCRSCASRMNTCPICRTPISDILKLIFTESNGN